MGLIRKDAQNVVGGNEGQYNWENLKPGDHEARLAYIADLGLQAKDFKGEYKGDYQQISLGFEVIGQGMEIEIDGVKHMEPRILWTAPFYLYSKMDKKGKEFEYYTLFVPDAEEGTVPDWEAQLGKPASLTVAHVQGKGENKDKVYDNIKAISRIPEKYAADVGPLSVEPGIGDSDDPENPVTKGLFGLPKHVYDKRVKPGDTNTVTEDTVEPVLDDGSPY